MVAAATSAAMIAQQVAGKAVRDALFLSSFEARLLPRVMALSAVLSLFVVAGVSRIVVVRSPATVMPLLFATSAIGLVLEWLLGRYSASLCAIAVYFHTMLLGPVLITTFWSLINERFDPYTAKRAVARIASGGTLGGVFGAVASWRASSVVEVPTLLFLLAALNCGCAVGSLLIPARAPLKEKPAAPPSAVKATPAEPPPSALAVLREATFLRNLAYLIALGAILSAVLDYIFSAQASAVFGKGAPLLSFFSLFWLAVSVASLILQVTFGHLALQKLGLAMSMAALPATVLLGGALGIAIPGLASASLLRGVEAVQRNTVFRSAYELLYTPISEQRKRATKALIDVGFDRLGTVLGSGVVVIALHFGARLATSLLLGAVVLLGLLTLPVIFRLHREYVSALEQGLRDGVEGLDKNPEPPTLPLARHTPDVEVRDDLIERVAGLDSAADRASSARTNPVCAVDDGEARNLSERLTCGATDLLGGDVGAARRALAAWSAEMKPLASLAILHLAHPELHGDALRALRSIAASVTGQLVDALLDPKTELVIRMRIPRALAICESQRAADGLMLGLAAERFEVRYECGRALARILDQCAQISLSREALAEAILREAKSEARAREETNELQYDDDDEPSWLATALAQDRRNRRLEHVFTILSLHLEREPLRMVFHALHHEDTRYRGTALEYLETVLPRNLRDAIWPFLGVTEPLPAPRPVEEILAELERAKAA
jgi:hypothetical protein